MLASALIMIGLVLRGTLVTKWLVGPATVAPPSSVMNWTRGVSLPSASRASGGKD